MSKFTPSKTDFWFLPLGGSGEIGMNLNLYGHDEQWLMVDCGVTFGDRLGVDIITPDPSFIESHKKSLKGLVITHAHEDHVGAVPYIWDRFRCPIYTTPFTATILKQKLKDVSWGKEVEIHEVPLSGTAEIGKFHIEFIGLTHSIPEPNALAISTPLGTIIHTGDWKIDPDPLVGEVTDHERLIQLGDQGILAMVCDSTNVFSKGVSGSEKNVREEMIDLVGRYPNNRIVIACFASNIARLETAAIAAKEHNRKAVLVGRSLVRMEQAARQNGYLKDLPPFIDEKTAMTLPPSKVLFIMTGSQGEPRSALARVASGQHPDVDLDKNDVVIFSSRVIPGNERSISALQNKLVQAGVKIVTSHEEDIHVSGHPARDELKKMYEWVRPKVLIPVHGEVRHMQEQATYALECGVPKSLTPYNGTLVKLDADNPQIIGHVHTGRLGYDGGRMIPIESMLLKERSKMSINGAVFATIPVDRNGILVRQIQLTTLGICLTEEEDDQLAQDIHRVIRKELDEFCPDEEERLENLTLAIRRIVKTRYDKKPLVSVHMVQV